MTEGANRSTMTEGAKRSGRTTKAQQEVYLEYLRENRDFTGKMDPRRPNLLKEHWAALSEQLNAQGPPVRTAESWQKLLRGWRNQVRSRARQIAAEQIRTGGELGKLAPLSDIEERALDVWGQITIEGHNSVNELGLLNEPEIVYMKYEDFSNEFTDAEQEVKKTRARSRSPLSPQTTQCQSQPELSTEEQKPTLPISDPRLTPTRPTIEGDSSVNELGLLNEPEIVYMKYEDFTNELADPEQEIEIVRARSRSPLVETTQRQSELEPSTEEQKPTLAISDPRPIPTLPTPARSIPVRSTPARSTLTRPTRSARRVRSNEDSQVSDLLALFRTSMAERTLNEKRNADAIAASIQQNAESLASMASAINRLSGAIESYVARSQL